MIPSTVPHRDLPRGLWLALTMVVVPLAALIAVQAYEAITRSPQLRADRALIAHTFEVIDTAERLKVMAARAERAQRGYLLTSEPGYLDAYRARAENSSALLAQLRKLTADNTEQQRRMAALASALEEWLAERQRTIDVLTQQGFAAVQRVMRGRAQLDTLRTVDELIDASIENERDLLTAREERAARHERQVSEVALASGAIEVAVLALGIALVVAAFRRAREFETGRHETEQRLNEQLLQAQAALAQTQKMEALGQLTGGVAHDFNNLLHVIRNAITILQLRVRTDDAEVKRYFEMIERNTKRAEDTTSRLLAFARQQPLDPKPTDLNKVVSGMAELLRNVLGESVSMEVVLGSGLWPAALDKNQLETAILNLALNSRDAMPGSGRLTIETSNAFLDEPYAQMHPGTKAGQYTMIAISDTGVGMTPEVAGRAFDPFFTTKESGHGTGLGLSQVFGFVKQSAGHVKIYSEVGQGTTIKMYFPRLTKVAAEQPAAVISLASVGSGESILVVEDDQDVRAFTTEMLRELGYRVTDAADGRAALEALKQLAGVDLLFTDVGLPNGMSGRELADEARQHWPHMKVLYTTGYARNSIIHHGRLDADVELITKPFTQSALAAKVRRVLNKKSDRAA